MVDSEFIVTHGVSSSVTSQFYQHSNWSESEELYSRGADASNMTSVDEANDIFRYVECPWEVPTCQAQKYLFLVVAPILVVMSTIGNGLGLAVMMRKSLRNTATAVFISALAVSDTIATWTGLSRHFIRKLTTVCILV